MESSANNGGMEDVPPQPPEVFRDRVKEIARETDRGDIELIRSFWKTFEDVYSRVLDYQKDLYDEIDDSKALGEIKALKTISDGIALDYYGIKDLMKNGLCQQSITLLRPSMEMSLKASILTCIGKLSDWMDGQKIVVRNSPKNKKPIEMCGYGELMSVMGFVVGDTLFDFKNDQRKTESYAQLIEIMNALLNHHRDAREEILFNDLIHRDHKLYNWQSKVFSKLKDEIVGQEDEDDFQKVIEDLTFQLNVPCLKSFNRQFRARYIETTLIQQNNNVDCSKEFHKKRVFISELIQQVSDLFQSKIEDPLDEWKSRRG